MKHAITVMMGLLALSGMEACSSGDGNHGATSGGAKANGGSLGSGGQVSNGGQLSSGGVKATGSAATGSGQVGSGGVKATGGSAKSGGGSGGGQSGGGATASGGQSGACPYTVASFSCEVACANLHELYDRCQNDSSLPGEMQATLGLYGQAEIICTRTCDVVAPASQAQWSCLQGVPDDAPCAAIGGCNATNCP